MFKLTSKTLLFCCAVAGFVACEKKETPAEDVENTSAAVESASATASADPEEDPSGVETQDAKGGSGAGGASAKGGAGAEEEDAEEAEDDDSVSAKGKPQAAAPEQHKAPAPAKPDPKAETAETKAPAPAKEEPKEETKKYTGSNPCKATSFKFSSVKKACDKGGLLGAKKLMKYIVKKAKKKGKKFKCSSCHDNTKTYTNKPNAVKDLKPWL